MCGRLTLKTHPETWAQLLLPLLAPAPPVASWQPRYNLAPSQSIVGLVETQQQLAWEQFRWGLVPAWADDLAIGNRMINARSETLDEKRSFAGLVDSQRCLIVADGYYEWQKLSTGAKRPWWISPADGGVMLLAGLWDTNQKATGEIVRSCTILTTSATPGLEEIHDRMPIPVAAHKAMDWIAGDAPIELMATRDDFFTWSEVSTRVNSPKNDSPDCIERVDRPRVTQQRLF